MSPLRMLFAARRVREAMMPRRVMKVWLATGAVPVAHMVADLDEIDDHAIVMRSGVTAMAQAATTRAMQRS